MLGPSGEYYGWLIFSQHYGPDTYNKIFIYRGDDWLFCQRWELLIQNRASVDIAQVLTWNDYGESHYIGPIAGAQPKSEAWVDGFDHQGKLNRIYGTHVHIYFLPPRHVVNSLS